MSTNCSYFC